MRFSLATRALLAAVFVASTHAIATVPTPDIAPTPDICCFGGVGPDPCGLVVKPAVMNPVPLASLPHDSVCCCVAINPLACRSVCDSGRGSTERTIDETMSMPVILLGIPGFPCTDF
ncbi:hypothetical protein B0H19DRAFT_1057203 [Mycena capillaripes]|nr:hypothetical protein B0H19DRAFT_1057203 [Mycena capillaripes]